MLSIESRIRPDKVGYGSFGEVDTLFNQCLETNSLVAYERQGVLFNLLRNVLSLDVYGGVAEVGVYRGGTARLICRTMEQCQDVRELYLFDTFSGIPDQITRYDKHHSGDFADVDLEAIREMFADKSYVHIIPGLFPQSAEKFFGKNVVHFAFVHVDVDIYQSCWDCCQFFYPLLMPGGIMLFDDYGARYTAGSGMTQAVQDYFMRPDFPSRQYPIYSGFGQAIIRKV